MKKEDLRELAENIHKHRLSDRLEIPAEKLNELVHELEVHQIELELQNEQLRDAQERLEQSNAEYRRLFDHAPVAYLTLNRHGVVVRANVRAAQELERDKGKLSNKPFVLFLAGDQHSKFFNHLEDTFESREIRFCELNLKLGDRTQVYRLSSEVESNGECHTVLTKMVHDNDRVPRTGEGIIDDDPALLPDLFDATGIGISMLSPKGEILQHNQSFKELLNVRNQPPAGIDETIPGYRFSIILRALQVNPERKHISREFSISVANDKIRDILVTTARFEKGDCNMFLLSVLDISTTKRAIRRSRLQAHLLNTVSQAIIAVDMSGTIIFWNHGSEVIFGYNSNETTRQSLLLLLAADASRDKLYRLLNRVEMEEEWNGEILLRKKSGIEFFCSLTIKPIYDDMGHLIGSVVVCMDISEKKKDEKTLMESMELYRLAVEEGNSGFFDWDLRSNTIHTSPKWREMIGSDPVEEDVEYKDFEENIHEEDRVSFINSLVEYMEGRIPLFEATFRYHHSDNSYLRILCRGTALRDKSGSPYRLLGSFTPKPGEKG